MSGHTPAPWLIDGVEIRAAGSHESESICEMSPCFNHADASLIAAAPDLLKALDWALPLAKIAIEDHRMGRLKAGHNDITGTYKNGDTWVGIYQSEIGEIEFADSAIAKAKGVKP